MAGPWLSVVVPAYNEADGIAATVSRIRDALEGTGRPWEILVVDNASTDGTPDALSPLLADGRITLLRNDANRGKGHSVRRGMLAARGRLRLHCDADCAPSLASLGDLLRAVECGADVAVGSRRVPGARVDRPQPLRRRVSGRAFAALCRLALREPTRDLFCGFKLFRAEAAEAAFGRTRLEGWTYDAELLAMARRLGFRIEEIGVAWADRDGSRLSMVRVLLPAVRELRAARAHVRAAG